MRATIKIGGIAGHHFAGQADLHCAKHAERIVDGKTVARGYLVRRRWLADQAAFDYDPALGWATEHWFDWKTQE